MRNRRGNFYQRQANKASRFLPSDRTASQSDLPKGEHPNASSQARSYRRGRKPEAAANLRPAHPSARSRDHAAVREHRRAPMSRGNGFLQLRRGLWEHVRDGRMTITEALAFVYICSEADTRTGIWKGSAKSLSGELGIPERTARDVL